MNIIDYYFTPHKYCLVEYSDTNTIVEKFHRLGFETNLLAQHDEGQQLSGHLIYPDGHQLHVRVYEIETGMYGYIPHYEYNIFRPVRHLACTDLSFNHGCKLFTELWK